jgi:hypothetical protein
MGGYNSELINVMQQKTGEKVWLPARRPKKSNHLGWRIFQLADALIRANDFGENGGQRLHSTPPRCDRAVGSWPLERLECRMRLIRRAPKASAEIGPQKEPPIDQFASVEMRAKDGE